MRNFLERHGVKAGVGVLAGLLSTELTRAAEPHLVELAINAVHASLHNAVTTLAGAQLAAAVGRFQHRRRVFRIAWLSSAVTLPLMAFFVWRALSLPPSGPVRPAFQVSNPRIAALASQWGQLDVRAAGLVRTFTPPPQPGDPRFAGFQQQIIALTQDGERMRLEYKTIAPDGGSPSQLAGFLTLELVESIGLEPKQQAAAFALLREELAAGGRAALLRDKALIGSRIRQSLSPSQQRKFDYVYREDFLALFSFVKLN